jgi:hypothetical protein
VAKETYADRLHKKMERLNRKIEKQIEAQKSEPKIEKAHLEVAYPSYVPVYEY